MTYLKFPDRFPVDQLATMPNRVLYQTYRKAVFEPLDESRDYTGFRKIFFGRNPYHRIISCYIDKYVEPFTSTPKDVPDCNSYIEFMRLLHKTGLAKEGMRGKVDFGHFCSVEDDFGWDIYRQLGCPDFDLISLLPATALPEMTLTHHFENIQTVFELLGIKDQYQNVQPLYENNRFSYDTWLKNSSDSVKTLDHLASLSKEQLWQIVKSEGSKTISYASFYPPDIADLFQEIYRKEFNFYAKRGYTFNLLAQNE
jgi:hypothetical protein